MSSDYETKAKLAISLTLPYLPVFERLLMTQVSTHIRQTDSLLPWNHFIFNRPINYRITDEILLKITAKSNGTMKSLTLNNCPAITDQALQTIAQRNPYIEELRIPNCASITAQGIVSALKALTSPLKLLRIDGVSSLDKHHMDLIHECMHLKSGEGKLKPLFYHEGVRDHPIDVDACPRCGQVDFVYDCARKWCNMRACFRCVQKCIECGFCVQDISEFGHRAGCMDVLCSNCWSLLPKCAYCRQPNCSKHANEGTSLGVFGFLCASCNIGYDTEFLRAIYSWPPSTSTLR